MNVRYLYQPGELECGTKRATDPIWSLKLHKLERAVIRPDEPDEPHANIICTRAFSRVLCAKSSWLSSQTHSFRLLMPCEIQWTPCGSHLAAPSVCHNTRSALASAAHEWPFASLLQNEPYGILYFHLFQCCPPRPP